MDLCAHVAVLLLLVAGQRERMLAATERMQKTSDRLHVGKQQMAETEVREQQSAARQQQCSVSVRQRYPDVQRCSRGRCQVPATRIVRSIQHSGCMVCTLGTFESLRRDAKPNASRLCWYCVTAGAT